MRAACDLACEEGAIDEAADFIWADWLLGNEPTLVNFLIDSHPRLRERFGSWRARVEDRKSDLGPAREYTETDSPEDSLPVHLDTDDCSSLFSELRRQINEAEDAGTADLLEAAKPTLEKLIECLRMRSIADADAAGAALKQVIARVRSYEALADPEAAARRSAALEGLIDMPALTSVKARAAVRDLEEKLTLADEAKRAFDAADVAHRAARFDRDKRHAYLDATDQYGAAETALTVSLERLTESPDRVVELDPAPPTILGQNLPQQAAPTVLRPTESTKIDSPGLEAPIAPTTEGASPPEGVTTSSESESDRDAQGPASGSRNGSQLEVKATGPEAASPDPQSATADLDPESDEPDDGDGHPPTIAERFLENGCIGLFAMSCEVGRELGYELPPPELAVLVGNSGLSEPLEQLRFSEALTRILSLGELDQFGPGEVCLLFASLCLPAITDPTYVSRNALSRLKLEHADFSSAMSLRKSIEDLGRAYSGIGDFQQSGGTDPEEEFKKARIAAQQTASAIMSKTINYQAATVVAHRLAQKLSQATDRDSAELDAYINRLDAIFPLNEEIDDVIRREDREAREDRADRKAIEARALATLQNLVRDARESTMALKRAASVLRERRNSGTQSKDSNYRKGRDLRGKFQLAADEFRRLSTAWHSKHAFASAAAKSAAKLLDAHAAAFDIGVVNNPFHMFLELDRYRLAATDFNPERPEACWTALQRFADAPIGTWLEAFDSAVNRREHRATEALLAISQQMSGARDLAAEREEAIARAREALRNEQRRVQDELLRVMNYAPPGETSLDPLYQSLASIESSQLPRTLDSDGAPAENAILDFPEAFGATEKARAGVNVVRHRALEQLESRLREQEGKASTDTIKHLRDLLQDGDLITLYEELSLIERGQPIIIAPPSTMVVEEFSRFLTKHGSITLVEWQRAQPAAGGRAATLIRKWQAVRTAEPRRSFRDLFGELGFEAKGEADTVSGDAPTARIKQFKIHTGIISDREFCSVARFGSEAQGQYRILLATKDSKPNEIVTAVPEGDTGATLVFVPHWLGRDMRLQIAAEARRLGRTFCLIDDALIAFLCNRDRVIHDLFSCGIPFAAANPYVTTPGSIPVEIFFGRTAELENISRRDGSCIVYGGRQLGKSVLLDHIEQRAANVANRIAIRLDCQDLTERRELFEFLEKKIPIAAAERTRGGILELMESWLRADPERTILLMLDETNKFVRADADRNFDVLLEFRGLMERTQRRFKVVLSGQNNVLRLTQTPNTPLAHFGQPICIGPLKGADYKAARDLVEEPLAAVGYKFAEEQLVSRILVETQFYPKLVQMFCRDLLTHLRSASSVHTELPPWQITIAHVEATLRNQKLTKDIFDTFKITLDLDKRYELIALIMALERADQRRRAGFETGMPERELRDQALYWWKEGFTSSNAREEFEGLLEELEGLGILITDRSTRSYQLASPVIANLIGSEASINERLLAFEQVPPPKDVDPSRRRIEDNPAPRKRGIWLSPLLPAQVIRITRARRREFGTDGDRTFIVYGTADMRLDRVRAALEPQKYDEHQGINLALLEDVTSLNSLAKRLASATKPTFFVIPPNLVWNASWVDTAVRSERGHVIVFVGDIGHAWSHIVDDPRGLHRLKGVKIETAAPLSLVELQDQIRRRRLAIPEDVAAGILRETGGFLSPVGHWTDRYLGSKRDQKPFEAYPRFENLPLAARSALGNIVNFAESGDALGPELLQELCGDRDPKRVFDWLLLSGLAELVVESGELLRLNQVFWSDSVRRLLQAA